MNATTYRDMHLLDELSRTPEVTQRELSKRIGVALGLTNLMLRRLVRKGYIKISGAQHSRFRYLITPQGILEKSRLTYEFIQYSLQLYGRVRYSLRGELTALAQSGHRRILLYGTGELAEIAFLTIREVGLEVVGVVSESPVPERFLDYSVKRPEEVSVAKYDRMLVVSLRGDDEEVRRIEALGVPADRILLLPHPSLRGVSMPGIPVVQTSIGAPASTTEAAGRGVS